MKRVLLSLLITLTFLTGCSQESDLDKGNVSPSAEMANQDAGMPADMPDDFNFAVRFGYGEVTKNEINTYQGTVTKDLITKGTATAHLKFTQDEMREIYGKMREINIMAPKKFAKSQNCSKSPSNEDEWTITVDGKTQSFSWTDRHCELSDDAIALLEIRNFIQSIVNGKAAYQALPAAEGGYD
ncbi:hypothetical protein FHS19_004061 [Paenibacillus rhizosphaerae]|uniref:Lipoprotein n=1 Tax=Paenibacillus rhizosphaerae TaxID=297318 RepID=A0A839TRE5_9BACL|nr:hypothetical protein [Paenibacillus rhizosphaerae]MBB3129386.1 hypothetical protein [Paenibacillus rhizosphaerae]